MTSLECDTWKQFGFLSSGNENGTKGGGRKTQTTATEFFLLHRSERSNVQLVTFERSWQPQAPCTVCGLVKCLEVRTLSNIRLLVHICIHTNVLILFLLLKYVIAHLIFSAISTCPNWTEITGTISGCAGLLWPSRAAAERSFQPTPAAASGSGCTERTHSRCRTW